MQYISFFGLGLDFAGVILLGWDLVRIQRELRNSAADRLFALSEVTENNENVDEWLDELGRNADWRETQWDEGLSVPLGGTFDPKAAQASYKDALSCISGLAADINKTVKMMMSAVESDKKAADVSLRVSYIGLALVCVGFLMQMLGQVFPY